MTSNDITVEILKEIRDAVRVTNDRVDQLRIDIDQRLDQTNARIDQTNTVLLDLAEQQRFVVRYLKGHSTRDTEIQGEIAALRARVEVLEEKVDRRSP